MTRDSANGRSIRIFLRDGEPSGARTAEITMSTTQAIAFRRRQLKKLGNELQTYGEWEAAEGDPR